MSNQKGSRLSEAIAAEEEASKWRRRKPCPFCNHPDLDQIQQHIDEGAPVRLVMKALLRLKAIEGTLEGLRVRWTRHVEECPK